MFSYIGFSYYQCISAISRKKRIDQLLHHSLKPTLSVLTTFPNKRQLFFYIHIPVPVSFSWPFGLIVIRVLGPIIIISRQGSTRYWWNNWKSCWKTSCRTSWSRGISASSPTSSSSFHSPTTSRVSSTSDISSFSSCSKFRKNWRSRGQNRMCKNGWRGWSKSHKRRKRGCRRVKAWGYQRRGWHWRRSLYIKSCWYRSYRIILDHPLHFDDNYPDWV